MIILEDDLPCTLGKKALKVTCPARKSTGVRLPDMTLH